MADEGTESTDTTATEAPATGGETDAALGDAGKQAIDRMKAERDAAVKERKALERTLEQARKSSMTEAEKAVAEAETRGRAAALADFGKRLARTEFDAAAGRRNPDFDVAPTLEWLDLSRFVGDDGEPDSKAIRAAVERLVPAPAAGVPSFDGGARKSGPNANSDMNALLRRAAGRA